MRKALLLLAMSVSVLSANAQLTLPATGPYTQNFDLSLPTYPTGWSTYNNATTTTLGTSELIQYFGQSLPFATQPDTPSICLGSVNVGGFKNFPSAAATHAGEDWCAATPPSYSNRALGVRQVSVGNTSHPNLDPGAAFVLKLANTTGHKSFVMTFKLQSLDTASAHITTWTVDYGVSASASAVPTTFTPATVTGTMTTGGHVYSNNPITASFGTALDNKAFPVYIRIVALTTSTLPAGETSGTRASSAIDDISLAYLDAVGVNDLSLAPQVDLAVLGAATSQKVTFAYATEEAGNYNFSIYDLTGRTIHTEVVNAGTGTQELTVNGLHLAPGMYIAKLNNANASSVARIVVQ